MLFEGLCVILLFAILIVGVLILAILMRKLLKSFIKKLSRKCRNEIRKQVEEGTAPILERLDEMEHQESGPVLERIEQLEQNLSDLTDEKFDVIFEHGVIPVRQGVSEALAVLHSLKSDMVGHGSSYMTGAFGLSAPGHSIHVFRNGSWELQEDFSQAGYEASRPTMEGSYEGQVVRTVSGFALESKS